MTRAYPTGGTLVPWFVLIIKLTKGLILPRCILLYTRELLPSYISTISQTGVHCRCIYYIYRGNSGCRSIQLYIL